MDKNEIKVDLIGSVEDSIEEGLSFIGFSLIVLLIVGCLIAPCLTIFFEDGLEKKYDCNNHPENYEIVRKKLSQIRLRLIILSIISWLIVMYISVNFC
jgi:hypothetical protein